jgi:hypothetical protein
MLTDQKHLTELVKGGCASGICLALLDAEQPLDGLIGNKPAAGNVKIYIRSQT